MGTVLDAAGIEMLTRAAMRPQYTLKVRQQPERARLCSYKEENETIDRRPVDPPPVVELRSIDIPTENLLESTSFFIRASIVSASSTPVPVPDHGRPSVDEPYYTAIKTPTGADATTGEVVQTPEKLRLLDGRPAALCVFAKISVRVPGVFRLMFTLYETAETGIIELARTVSDPFEVFSPKLFKGMHESTPLTRHLAAQGLKVKLRTDTSVGRQSTSRRRTPVVTTPTSSSGQYDKAVLSSSSSAPTMHPISAPGSGVGKPQPGHRPAHSPLETRPLRPSISAPPPHYRMSSAPTSKSHRSLVWRQAMEPFGYANEQAIAGPGPTTTGKRRFTDDGLMPSLRELSARFDWTPTPPATDLAAFSLSRHGSPGHPGTASYRPASSSNSSSYRGSETASLPGLSSSNSTPSTYASGPLSAQTRRSSNLTATSSGSSALPSPIPRLNLGPGDDGIPTLPLPSMFASSSSRPRAGLPALSGHQLPPLAPPSAHRALESPSMSSPSASASPSVSVSQHPSNLPSVIYNSPRTAVSSPRMPVVVGNGAPYGHGHGHGPGPEPGHGRSPPGSGSGSRGELYHHVQSQSQPQSHLQPNPARSPIIPLTLPPIRPEFDRGR